MHGDETQQLPDFDGKDMNGSLSSGIQTVSLTDSLDVNEESSKHHGEKCKISEISEFKTVRSSDIDMPMLNLDKIKCNEDKQEVGTVRAAVETDAKSSGKEDMQQDVGSLNPSDNGIEEDNEMELQLLPLDTLSKASNSYNGQNTGIASQKHRQQQHDDANILSLSPASAQQSTSSTNVIPELKQSSKKQKEKEILAKADAAGSSADLYNAYKAFENVDDEVKKGDIKGGAFASSETKQSIEMSKVTVEIPMEAVESLSLREVDDWEDGAEVLSPKARAKRLDAFATANCETVLNFTMETQTDKNDTRDFMLTFRKQNRDLPSNFEIGKFTEILVNSCNRDLLQNSGRFLDCQLSGGPWLEQGGSSAGNSDEERRIRQPGLFSSAENRLEMGVTGFRPGVGMNQGPIVHAPAGLAQRIPLSNIGPGLTSRISGSARAPDIKRWQRALPVQRGQISIPLIHKVEKKYEVGKISDKEEGKQRQIKGILNKLTPQNFDRLFEQVGEMNIETAHTLNGVVSQIFDKVVMEPFFFEMYVTFCVQLLGALPEFIEDGTKISFKRVLLNKCQEKFERRKEEQAEENRPEEGGEVKLSVEERDERRLETRRQMLGKIRFIGELYKRGALTERIMHHCIKVLLRDHRIPHEGDVEALCKLMSTIGQKIDHSKAKHHIDAYFDTMLKMSDNQRLPSRLRFMLKDVIDLRRNGWKERRKVEGPKDIEEVHRNAAQERQTVTGRFSRGSNMGSFSGRRETHREEPTTRRVPVPLLSSPATMAGNFRNPQQPLPNSWAGRVQDICEEDELLLFFSFLEKL